MIFSLGHGQQVVMLGRGDAEAAVESAAPARPDAVSFESVYGGGEPLATETETAPAPAPIPFGPFAYMFPDAAGVPHEADAAAKLDAVADLMVEAGPGAQVSTLAPVLTYFGQFIDHDITVMVDRDAILTRIDGDLAPVARADAAATIVNGLTGSLGLDSVYGDTPGSNPVKDKLLVLMRDPADGDRMRLGRVAPVGMQDIPFPQDGRADLLRLVDLLGNGIEEAEIRALSPAEQAPFLNGQDIRVQLAIIGDGRNDENLIVAQFQLAMLRFHNAVVDALPAGGDRFTQAREEVRRTYQWLVANLFLPAICDPDILQQVVADEAPVYAAFRQQSGGGLLPLPFEFSVGAYRFGHSMIRGRYDHNRNFPQATFEELFQFTGRGANPMIGFDVLPDNWPIEWDRFIAADPQQPRRTARPIDTQLAPPLDDMLNEPAGIFKSLAKRNLRRGHRLDLPCAQAILESVNAALATPIAPLTAQQLSEGRAGPAIAAGGFAEQTPLWYYVLREAELAGGNRLGPLGSLIVAETLIGLLVQDPNSVWHAPGSGPNGRWHPDDGVKPAGEAVADFGSLFRAAGVLG
jgi:hypothetical protein